MVRIWCLPVEILDRQHLLGLHFEIGVAVNTIIRDKTLLNFPHFHMFLKSNKIRVRWINHPQVKRFKNHLGMLYDLHEKVVIEMKKRGYKHNSPLLEIRVKPETYKYSREEYESDLKLLKSRQ